MLSDKTYAILHNLVYFSFLGLGAYFITPYILFALLIHSGIAVVSKKVKDNAN